jgi:DUF4097 and DUF4098 domain-containing protein YvlB
MRTETFVTEVPPSLVLHVPAGEIELEAVETGETRIELEGLNDPGRTAVEQATIEQKGDEVRIELAKQRGGFFVSFRTPRVRVKVTCPIDARLRAGIISADLNARGRLAAATVKSVSGDVSLDEVSGDLELKTVSGDGVLIRVGGEAKLNTVSGDVHVRQLGGSADAKTVSGDLELDSVSTGKVTLQSVSGDVTVGVAPGVGVWMDLNSVSGDTRSELAAADGPVEESATVEIRAKSISGDIRLARA